MDSIFEFIIPIAFAAIYLFGNKLSDKAKEVFEEQSEDTDLDEQQRRIQEEIRRKIIERRGDSQQPSTSVSFPEENTSVSEPQPEAEFVASTNDTFASQLQARLEKVEATNRQAQELKKQGAIITSFNGRSSTRSRTGGLFSGSVRSSFRDPAAARAAFIYGEVLGTPVSQKKVSSVPGLC